jgi:hypothetical protein
LRESAQKLEWGQVEKIGKGTKANYDSAKKVLTFCFNRSPDTSSELLRASRELLMKELRELGYGSRMKYNGEVVKKNHKLMIRLNQKQAEEKAKSVSESLDSKIESQSRIKFS